MSSIQSGLLCVLFLSNVSREEVGLGDFGCFIGVFSLLAAVEGVLNASHCYQPLGSIHTEQATITCESGAASIFHTTLESDR